MLKKFVPLNCNASPSKNPYEVRTYIAGNVDSPEWQVELCSKERKCEFPANSTISKVQTIEDELRRLQQKAKESRYQRVVKKRCAKDDEYTACTFVQRTPKDIRTHAVLREQYMKMAFELSRRVHDGSERPVDSPSRVELASPEISDDEGKEATSEEEEEEEEGEPRKKQIKPKPASPACSLDLIYMPPQKMLELKRPKSGMFHNETDPPQEPFEDGIPYSSYNPRVLQEKFNEQKLETIDLIEGRDPNDLWTWNIGLQKRESDMNRAFIQAHIQSFDCNHMELTTFKIPTDLDKTFSAEIVFGTEHVEPEPPSRKKKFFNRPMEVACLFAAYVESFRFNPDFWTSEILDGILVSAGKLLKKSNSINYKASQMDFDIIPQLIDKQAEIGLKVHFTGPLESEPNIYKVLSLYFSKFNAAVLCSHNLYLLIWKRCTKTFYVFDPYGRNELCQRDFENGKCSLMAVTYVEHLVHLIVSFSQVDMNNEFNLYEITLKNYGKITHPLPVKPFQKRTRRLWAVVNGTYAVIPAANNGLQQPITGNELNASMIISLLSLLYSDIERASLWRMEVIDDLIKFGTVYYKNFMKRLKLKKKQQLNVVDLPEVILMGTFRATLQKAPFLFTGHVTNCKTFIESQLTVVVRDLFASKWEAALLQIDNLVLALWRDMEYFYLFDPFRRGKAGQVLDPDDYLTKGVACLQMHTNFESFCRILFQKAIKMRRGGKFFVHGVNIGCIKPVINAPIRTKYPRLQLVYPSITAEPSKLEKDKKDKKDKKSKKGRKSVDRTFSIQSIQEDDRIPEFEDIDVVTTLLEEVLCEIFELMMEPVPDHPQLYKQAEKVLLRSDKEYLEALKYKVKHGEDYDNVYSAFQIHPEPPARALTLEEELQIHTNYETLPDGSWVIMGNVDLPMMDDDSNKLCGLLSSLITAALTAKYNISTWNSDLVDYALDSAERFASMYTGYEPSLSAFLAKTLPKITIGENTYRIELERVIKSSMTRSLRQMLLESLINYNRLLVICQRFSCLIVKRYNFLYMFIGFPCTPVGYRKFFNGPACMLRFVELDSLIRRIEFGCNPQGCEITNYVAVAVKVVDADAQGRRFREWRPSEEEKMYCTELERQKKIEQMKLDKIRFLDKELRKENQRIQSFLTEKQMRAQQRKEAMEAKRNKQSKQKPQRKPRTVASYSRGSEEEFLLTEYEMGMEELEEEEEEETEIELKHKPGKKLQRERDFPFKPRPVLYGYHMREKDCLFKIQGSTALTGRDESAVDKIKPCFFVSTLAVLYAILRPLNQWSSQRVDRVIESGRVIAARVSNPTSAFERYVNDVTVDDYKFDVWVKTYDPVGVCGTSVGRKITKATQTRHYLLLQISNSTFAIYRDEHFHLFDPYATMETMVSPADEDEEEGGKKNKCPAGIKRYGERNTASWVLFADVEAMLKYIDSRATNEDWQTMEEYAFHVVDVLSYKKAGPRTRILQLLTDLSVPMECKISQHGEDESTICAHPETISWLELESCLPVWSRMNRRNTAGRYRNLPVTKVKRYDIEIDGRLWSLWGNLHPQAPVFDPISRGKQYLACNVMACCAARIYQLTDWSPHLLDTIVINGDRYHRESLESIKQVDYEFSLEDLNMDCMLENIKFVVHLEHVAFGKIYSQPSRTTMNLADALMYFFGYFQFGILQCHKRSLAIGRTLGHDGGYFMFDCQSRDHPLFPKGQGAAYLLRTKHLQVLLYCIVVTLNVPYYNVQFTLHKVEMLREGAAIEEDQEEEAT